MITILEKHNNHLKNAPVWKIECDHCGTIFTASAEDMHYASAGHGFWQYAIRCPNCYEEQTEQYHNWELVRD